MRVAVLKKQLKGSVGWVLALGLICFGAWGLVSHYQATHRPVTNIPTDTLTHTTSTPEETPPTAACERYSVPANQPRKIELPGIDASGCIQKVGLDKSKAIAAPSNVHLAGWYVGSVAPGNKGVSIIDGHVSGRYAAGIFSKLKDLRPGDSIRVQFGDLSWRKFTIADTRSVATEQASQAAHEMLKGSTSQLSLITCHGTYNKQSEQYDKRIVIRASRAKD